MEEVLLVLDEFLASSATLSGTSARDGSKEFMPMLCLHLKVRRHTKGTAAPELVQMPPIHVELATAEGLPAALLSAIHAKLPQALAAAQANVQAAIQGLGAGTTAADRH